MPNLLVGSPTATTSSDPGFNTSLHTANAYAALGERPIPLCDPDHAHCSVKHREGYRRADGTQVPPCCSPGKAPFERNYGRFASTSPSKAEISRMFGSNEGNIGGVVPDGRIAMDIDLRSGGLESIEAYIREHGPLRRTVTVLTGGGGYHHYFCLPPGLTVPSGGSLAASSYPGLERKEPGAQVVLPPSIHSSGTPYRWESGCALGQVTIEPIPDPLLRMILDKSSLTPIQGIPTSPEARPSSTTRPPLSFQDQDYFIMRWQKAGVEVQSGAGDQFYSCPFYP